MDDDQATTPAFEDLRGLVDGRVGEGLLFTDPDGTIRWVNAVVERALGRPADELVGSNAQALLHPEDAARSRFRNPDVPIAPRSMWDVTRRLLHRDGTYRLFDCIGVDLRDDGHRLIGVVVRPTSTRYKAWDNERRLAATVEHTQDIVLVYGADLCLLYASPTSRALAPNLDGTFFDHITRFVAPPDFELAMELAEKLLAAPGALLEQRLRFRTDPGDLVWLDLRAVNLLEDADVRSMVLVGHNVTEQVELEARLRDEALHDPLTALPNRPSFMTLLETSLLDRVAAGTTAVLYLDLDRFKVVNDSFGHATGDRVLIELATRLQTTLAGLATVGRFGGDEYVMVTRVEDRAAAERLADAVVQKASEPFTIHGPDDEQAEVFLSASVGIALAADGVDAPAMLHHADAAMYRAKAGGRGPWEVYDDGMRDAARARLSREAQLARAFDEGQFELHYQPIVDVRSRRVSGFEALARWRNGGGWVSPAEFVPIAEDTGGIHRLGAWALHAACEQLAAWSAEGLPPMTVAVNVSPRQLTDDAFAQHVATALAMSTIDPTRLCLEITETVLVDDLERAVDAIEHLRGMGVRLALDDFGTGWSSLTHLRSVPVDVVKIDRSFVSGITAGGGDRAIVGAVVTMCRALGQSVVAEGVETEEQLLATRELGCTHAQGYLMARPQPGADIPGWLQRYRDNGNRAPD